ncbi:protein of unknown function [Candidatus Nitrosocosmicus franklandus]|uniref:Uncharacterized protein n=1 Tax=Candidatus Nitrosocosmicus franklandianus TaxID=1798806 RepID=A0A484IC91_9ARCH|nr:protein of unknown function [Candidatus Nitrosocosmicus franklandus]
MNQYFYIEIKVDGGKITSKDHYIQYTLVQIILKQGNYRIYE